VSGAVAIVNPRAGGGRGAKRWPAYEAAIGSKLGAIETLWTERPNHATELARQALRGGADLVIAVGGDGSVNEVVNGFFEDGIRLAPRARLAYVPFGTGGDLQRSLHLPTEPGAVAEALAGGGGFALDLARAKLLSHEGEPVERYFLNLLSFGMGGDVSIKAKKCFLTNLHGKAAFLYATFVVFCRYQGKTVRIRLDDGPSKEFFITNIAVGNGRYHGGGMLPCPGADLDDGLLEVTCIQKLTMWELIRDIGMLYSGDVYKHPKVERFAARKIVAESDDVTRIEVDGEALGRLLLEVQVMAGAIELAVPKGFAARSKRDE
jgi:diacylglycerol kinase (ATP)